MQNKNKQRTFARTRATPAARPTQARAGLLRPGLGWSPGLCAALPSPPPTPCTVTARGFLQARGFSSGARGLRLPHPEAVNPCVRPAHSDCE